MLKIHTFENLSEDAKKLFKVATAGEKYVSSQKAFTFFDDIFDFDAVIIELNNKTSLLNELLIAQAISSYAVLIEPNQEIELNGFLQIKFTVVL